MAEQILDQVRDLVDGQIVSDYHCLLFILRLVAVGKSHTDYIFL